MMIRTLCLLAVAGFAAARPSADASSVMYVVPGSYYSYYSLGLKSLVEDPEITLDEGSGIEEIKTPEITEPILHLSGVPIETKIVEEPIEEIKETEPLKEEDKGTETLKEDPTTEIPPVKEPETPIVEIVKVPEEPLVIAEEITERPVVVGIVTEKVDEKDRVGSVIPSWSVIVKPLSQYSSYLPSMSWLPSLPSFSSLSSLSSWWPFKYGADSRLYRYHQI